MLSALACCFDDCCTLVDGFSQPGWLLRVACNEQMREEFVTLHEAVEEILKVSAYFFFGGGGGVEGDKGRRQKQQSAAGRD
jgi:hypothetical protein